MVSLSKDILGACSVEFLIKSQSESSTNISVWAGKELTEIVSRMEGGGSKMGKNGEKSYKTGEDIASSVKLLYLRILYRCIASKNRFLIRLCRFIARRICLYRQKCRFIAQNLTNFITSSVQENCCLVFSIASSVTKILVN
jgi:hypothetical protein